jgi:hypothetical protein
VTETESQCDPPLASFSIALQTEEENVAFEMQPVNEEVETTTKDNDAKESSMNLEALALSETDRVSSDPDALYRLKIQILCRKLQEADARLLQYEKNL